MEKVENLIDRIDYDNAKREVGEAPIRKRQYRIPTDEEIDAWFDSYETV